jgi:hypothetical protein
VFRGNSSTGVLAPEAVAACDEIGSLSQGVWW